MLVRKLSDSKRTERLSARRRLRRRRGWFALGVFLLLLLTAGIYGLNQSVVRISNIKVFGSSASSSISIIASEAMQGSYFGIIPRNSTFFLPVARIRAGILTAYPDIAAVSIFRNGFSGLSIKVDDRIPIARWCGLITLPSSTTPPLSGTVSMVSGNCYYFDANGFVFALATVTPAVNSFILYESPASKGNPVGSTLPHAGAFPATFDFARQLGTLGSPVSSVVIHGNEVDDYLSSGTEIAYLLGHEQAAYAALVSARADFNLSDGSITYVDLRFKGKIYLKKKG